MTPSRVRLAGLDDIPPGTVKRCDVAGHPALAVYNLDGEIFITEDSCTHGMASLSDGTLIGDIIECPWHGGAFHVRTGEPAERPCIDRLRTFNAIVEDGAILVELGSPRN